MCISLPRQTRYFFAHNSFLWHYKISKKKRKTRSVYTSQVKEKKRKKKKWSIFSYIINNEKTFKARCWTEESKGWSCRSALVFVGIYQFNQRSSKRTSVFPCRWLSVSDIHCYNVTKFLDVISTPLSLLGGAALTSALLRR